MCMFSIKLVMNKKRKSDDGTMGHVVIVWFVVVYEVCMFVS